MSPPISRKEYEKRTKEKWIGVKVRSRVPLANRLAKMPAGTLFTIKYKGGGFTLETEPCPTCGVRFYISKVQPGDVSIVEEAKTNAD